MFNIKEKSKDLTEAEIDELKNEFRESLSRDRHKILIKFPFTGGIMMRLNIVPTRDIRVRTACTDGTDVYFDMEFYAKLNPDERVFVLAHEAWHCVMLHMLRKQSRMVDLFNVASDMEINHLLKQNGLIAPPGLCFPPTELEGKSAEEIYEWLLKEQKKQQKNQNQNNSGGGNGGKLQSGNSGKGKNSGNGNEDQSLSGQFDKHNYKGDNPENGQNNQNDKGDGQNGEGNGEGGGDGTDFGITDRWGKVGFDKDFQPKISENLSEEMREKIVSEAQKYERMRGKLPAGIERYVKDFNKPEIRWQEVLAQFVTSCYQGHRQWLPPNRRHIWSGTYLQSSRHERIRVTVAIDTSGSTTYDLPKFLSELIGLVKSFGDYELNVIQCDAAVHSAERFDSSNIFDPERKEFKFKGFGGTDFCPVFDYIKEHPDFLGDCLIFFTDGYGTAPKYPPHYPVLWILTSDGSHEFCDWGWKTHFKEKREISEM